MNDDRQIYVIGAGGHSKVMVSTLQDAGFRVLGLVDDDPSKWNSMVFDLRVLGAIDEIERLSCRRAAIANGNNSARKRVAERLRGVEWVRVVHPRAYVQPSVRLGPGTAVFAGAVIQPDSVLGMHCIINTGVSVDHDCVLGDFVHAAPGSRLGGKVELGDGVFLGIGSSVLPCIHIGRWTVVGGGGAVTADLESEIVAVGVPAKTTKRKPRL